MRENKNKMSIFNKPIRTLREAHVASFIKKRPHQMPINWNNFFLFFHVYNSVCVHVHCTDMFISSCLLQFFLKIQCTHTHTHYLCLYRHTGQVKRGKDKSQQHEGGTFLLSLKSMNRKGKERENGQEGAWQTSRRSKKKKKKRAHFVGMGISG